MRKPTRLFNASLVALTLMLGATACGSSVKSEAPTVVGAKNTLDAFFASAAADVAKNPTRPTTAGGLSAEFGSATPYLYEQSLSSSSKEALLKALDSAFRANAGYDLSTDMAGIEVTKGTGIVWGKNIKLSQNGTSLPYDMTGSLGGITIFYVDGKWFINDYHA